MRLVEYNRSQRRLWIAKQRCHHGALGCLAIALGALLAIHDRRDFRVWFTRGQGEVTH